MLGLIGLDYLPRISGCGVGIFHRDTEMQALV